MSPIYRSSSPEVDVERVRRGGFAAFIQLAWHQVVGDDLVYGKHMDLIAKHLEAVMRNEIKDLVINVPPGTSKSTLCSILFPAWAWAIDPKLKFMYTTYDQQLSHGFARTTMELVQSDWFQARWPHVQIKNAERANVGDYWTTAGGRRVSTMMGGAATGKHAHILFVDDPHKPDDLEGDPDAVKKVLDEAWSRWINTFSKRRADAKTFRRVCIMQRLHEEDLAGRMLKAPNTVHLCLPTRFEVKFKCVTSHGEDWRTEEGELLCPERFPEEVIAQDEVEMTPRDFASQHQQRPVPPEGALFKHAYFQNRWKTLPPTGLTRWTLSVDSNLKDRKDSDYCAIQLWAIQGPNYWLVDKIKGRWSFGDALTHVKMMIGKWPQIQNILVEDKANGTAIIDELKQNVSGVIPVDPLGGKMARAEACEWLLRAGNVVFPDGRMGDEVETEATSFPVGSNDDDVDAMTQVLLWFSGKRKRWQDRRKAMQNARKGLTFK